jgi:hypothetical protein
MTELSQSLFTKVKTQRKTLFDCFLAYVFTLREVHLFA